MKIINTNTYDILIGFDIKEEEIKSRIKAITTNTSKVLFVIDDKVSKEYINNVYSYFDGISIYTYELEAIEENKSLISYQEINALLVCNAFSRSDCVVAIGGGITSDLVGFVSSTFKRGMKDIYFPTTTLAMIDASIGGKCAINFLDTKNVIGSFYDPSLVVMDLNSLNSLDKRNYNSGLVEGLKMGLTSNKKLFDEFEKEAFDIERIIELSVITKLDIVEKDKYDKGDRNILNFGHSIAHAIELNSNYLHGECVAFGMVQNILNDALKNKVINILKKLEIDIENMNIDLNNINVQNDKKVVNGKLRESYLIDIENVEYKNIEI